MQLQYLFFHHESQNTSVIKMFAFQQKAQHEAQSQDKSVMKYNLAVGSINFIELALCINWDTIVFSTWSFLSGDL